MDELTSIEMGLALIAVLGACVLRWGARNLTGEGWQIALAIPARTNGADGRFWPAINITSYGVISALAYGIATFIYIFLIGAYAQPLLPAVLFVLLLLAVGIPASKLVAKWVEGVPGHTIGGAVFAVMVSAIPALESTAWLNAQWGGGEFNKGIVVAAACIAYVLGEAIGRLACLSFGCCYGRPIDECTSLQKALYSKATETYRGKFKKIAYASGLNDRPVIAVQSIASALLFGLFLAALWLFWRGQLAIAIVVSLGASQLWRAHSEQLRADFRGRDGFTLYQGMALAGVLLSLVFAHLYASDATPVQIASAFRGWGVVAQAEVIVPCQLLALGILLYMGRSSVTSSRLELLLHESAKK